MTVIIVIIIITTVIIFVAITDTSIRTNVLIVLNEKLLKMMYNCPFLLKKD